MPQWCVVVSVLHIYQCIVIGFQVSVNDYGNMIIYQFLHFFGRHECDFLPPTKTSTRFHDGSPTTCQQSSVLLTSVYTVKLISEWNFRHSLIFYRNNFIILRFDPFHIPYPSPLIISSL